MQVRHCLVVIVFGDMEWYITHASKECRIYLHLRRIQIMGLRCGGLELPLVSTGMATHMGEDQYSNKRDGARSDKCSCVGSLVEGKVCSFFLSDNESVVSVLNTRKTKARQLLHLSCSLFVFAASHQFTFVAKHIAGKKNGVADALSRNQLNVFFSLVPHAATEPQELITLLLEQPVEWTSPHWRQLFKATMDAVLLAQRTEPTTQLRKDSSHFV